MIARDGWVALWFDLVEKGYGAELGGFRHEDMMPSPLYWITVNPKRGLSWELDELLAVREMLPEGTKLIQVIGDDQKWRITPA